MRVQRVRDRTTPLCAGPFRLLSEYPSTRCGSKFSRILECSREFSRTILPHLAGRLVYFLSRPSKVSKVDKREICPPKYFGFKLYFPGFCNIKSLSVIRIFLSMFVISTPLFNDPLTQTFSRATF